MSITFHTYPVMTPELFNIVGYVSDAPVLSYSESYEEFPLQLDDDGTGARKGKVKDPRCSWHAETHTLICTRKCRFTSAYCLFGHGGIAPTESIIGVALRWISTGSDERGILPFGELSRNDSAVELTANITFEKGRLKDCLKLETILYLKDPGSPDKSEVYFARQPGTILGTLDQTDIFIDGNGSVFPIAVVNAPGKPLWEVYFNEASDPMEDKFDSENVEIRLNQAHPDYESLKIESSIGESTLFMEVLSSAMMVIISCAKDQIGEEWGNVLSGEGYSTGSVAEAINYFIDKLEWDVTNAANLSLSIRKFFEKNTRG